MPEIVSRRAPVPSATSDPELVFAGEMIGSQAFLRSF